MIVTGAVSAYDLIVTQGFPNSGWPTISNWLPTWGWWAWVVLILALVLIAIVEDSYRLHSDAKVKGGDFAILWVKESGYFERAIEETDTTIWGVNCYIVFKPMQG